MLDREWRAAGVVTTKPDRRVGRHPARREFPNEHLTATD